ncbi:MAG: HAD family hydrolase [Candidatus Omnitrophota bacterium]
MIEKKIFIFDLDGTLVDAYRAIEKSLNFTLRKLGYRAVSYREAKRKVGTGDKHFMEMFFKKNEFRRALRIYRVHHEWSLARYTRSKSGAKRMLYLLKKRNKIIAVASNRPARFTDIIVRHLDIKKYFDGIWCADKINGTKPDPKMVHAILARFGSSRAQAVYIGDMGIDLETAHRAGVDAVFIKGGSSGVAEVATYKNKRVISSLMEILKIYR